MLEISAIELTTVRSLRASACLIHDSYGNPVVLVLSHGAGVTEVVTRQDPEFNDRLRLLEIAAVSPASKLTVNSPADWPGR